MNRLYSVILGILMVFTISGFASKNEQSVQVFTAKNIDGKITAKIISDTFTKVGLVSAGNNNMNKPFMARFKTTHYDVYNLAMFQNDDLTLALIKKYPKFGVISPLTMSIWSDGESINVSTLSLEGMARVTGISIDDPDLIAYADMVKKGLRSAMPKGNFKEVRFKDKYPKKSFLIEFKSNIEEGTDLEIYREDFEAELEAELEAVGFLMPNYSNLQGDIFEQAGYDAYDFYVTYSLCKFDVIFPVSRLYPEAGAYAPCTLYMYKKKNENIMHIGYLGVQNWITTLDIKDEESISKLLEAENLINNIINDLVE